MPNPRRSGAAAALSLLFAVVGTALLGATPEGDAATAPASRSTDPVIRSTEPSNVASAAITRLRETPSAAQLRRWHDLLGNEPHVAGTPGDARVIERLHGALAAMGLDVEVQRIHPLLARPVDAALEIVDVDAGRGEASATGSSDGALSDASASSPAPARRRGVISLPLQERNLLEDPATAHPGLSYGWNAYSGSGEVEAEVIYVNHGTRADFDALGEMGVDPRGRILLARYGGNFRGDKVRFAEAAGAAGMVIFSDPADVARGEVYPDGGWANDTCIQRGSILRLGRPGDPLTPGVAATADAPRLAIADIALPKIPVQPIGYAAAGAILSRMTGTEAPETWRGGLPLTYRVEGGPTLRLKLRVEQVREVMETANVVATLRGETDEEVIVGCHHDAWGFGAADPLAGTITLLEIARAFGEAARDGWRPRRTIRFAAWAAEEFGIIGSTEWCEAHAERLSSRALAYVNLDMAAMGPNFHASAAPTLASVFRDAARRVPQAGDPSRTVHEAWSARADGAAPTVGLIGGGSDHEAFQYHLGIPSLQLGAGGAPGTSYHSNYDTLQWYRQIVGEDYEPALMVTRMGVEVVLALAGDARPPIDPSGIAPMIRRGLEGVEDAAAASGIALDATTLLAALERLERREDAGDSPTELLQLERRFLVDHGPEGASRRPGVVAAPSAPGASMDAESGIGAGAVGTMPWSRHRLYGTDPDAGYSTETLPLLRRAVRAGDRAAAQAEIDALTRVIDDLAASLDRVPTG